MINILKKLLKNLKKEITLEQKTILKYTTLGIQSEKIHYTNLPNTWWSFSKKKLVENLNDQYELIKDGENYRLEKGNITIVCCQMYTEIDQTLITRINNSEGIIVSSETYNRPYRFSFIPKIEDCVNLEQKSKQDNFIPSESYEFFNIII